MMQEFVYCIIFFCSKVWNKWKISENYNKTAISSIDKKKIEAYQSIAFLVIQNDSIKYEEYWDNKDYKIDFDVKDNVQNFISEYKESKVDNNKILEQGLKNKKFLSYNDFKGKLTQNHSEDSLKQKYEDYTKDKIKELSKVQDTNPSIDYDNSIQMKVWPHQAKRD